MKLLLQISLFFIMLFIGYIFYNNYFADKKTQETFIINSQTKKNNNTLKENEIKIKDKEENKVIKNNVIKNLKYKLNIAENGTYEIRANSSEINLKNGQEIVLMKGVIAIFSDKNSNILFISSDNAVFNSVNYNTLFEGNIKIQKEEDIITSNKLEFDFIKNIILVYENVKYIGLKGEIIVDNIKINLITRNVEFFMNNDNDNVKILSY